MPPFEESPLADEHSDVALLVAAVREWPREEFARELDARVARAFAPPSRPRRRATGLSLPRLPRWAAGAFVALASAVVAAVIVLGGPGGGLRATGGGGGAARVQATSGPAVLLHASPAHGGSRPGAGSSPAGALPAGASAGGASINAPAAGAASSATSATGAQLGAALPAGPVAPGAKQIRSAQISLRAADARVDQVAQETFEVVSAEHGTVISSQITQATPAAGGGYASISLSVPTANLEATMAQLSRLRYATVSSRSDSSQNVSDAYSADRRRLADAEALRLTLLRQLQQASTQTAIDSIQAQLKLAEAQLTRSQTALARLDRQISTSEVNVSINEFPPVYFPVVANRASTGFTLARAGHDALRVLVVSAGIGLVALAVMVPLGLVLALVAWLWAWLRQRRRERALDAGA